MSKLNTKDIIKNFLNLETFIVSIIQTLIIELLRLDYESKRGKELVKSTFNSLHYKIDELEEYINKMEG